MAKKKRDRIDKIMAFEDGSLPEKETLKLFQEMIDDGSVWKLQGFYGRTAQELLNRGLVKYPKKQTYDYYGNPIPTRKRKIKKVL